MIRYLDTFFHYLWLWLIPLLVFPAGATVLLVSSNNYTAKATLWVDQPIFSAQQNTLNIYDSPAKQMGSLLTELLNTREFVNSVIGSTSRKQAIKSTQEQSNAIDYITTKTKIAGDNTRLITISFPDSKAIYALETLQAIIDRFQDYYNGRVKTQGEGAQVYYQQILEAAKAELDKATDEVKKFIEDHPNQVGTNSQQRASNAEELEYSRLNQNLDNARKSYDTAKANLDNVTSNYDAYLQGQATTIRVLDKPAIQEVGGTQLRQTVIGVGLGVVLALIVSIIGTIILTFLDPNLRYAFYARQILGREYIVELPNYGLSKKAKKQKSGPAKYNLESFVKNNMLVPGKKLLGRKANKTVILRKVLSSRIRLSPEE